MEKTRLQAFKELRSLLSEVLTTAVADEEVPEAFKDSSNWEKLISQTEHRLAEGWRLRFEGVPERRQSPRTLDLLPEEEQMQQLLSERFVNEVSYNDRGPLDELDRQLAALSGPNFNEQIPNPLGPSAWVEGIRGGMRQLKCTPDERDWLMARLIPLLASRITGFYSGMTTRLTSAGYGGRAPPRISSAGASARGNDYSPDLVPALGDGQSGFGGGGDAGAMMGGAASGDGNEAIDRLFSMLSARRAPVPDPYGAPGGWPQGAPVPGGWMPGPGYGGLPGGGFPGQMSGGYPIGPGGIPGAVPTEGGEGFPHGVMPAAPAPIVPWSQACIFSILSLMQGSYTSGPG
ncbi:MAG: DUF1631 family protein, partial [Frankiaceae bacterium]|nr:DUF1631 family protein [Arenimonas sp.]